MERLPVDHLKNDLRKIKTKDIALSGNQSLFTNTSSCPWDCIFLEYFHVVDLLPTCVCVCVCLYPSTCWLLPAARRLWHTWEDRINDLLLWVFIWVLLPSPFISVSKPVLFHLRTRKLQPAADWRENEWYNTTVRKDDILI